MASRLGVYNNALSFLGERRLEKLTENREPRRALDAIWNDGFVDYVLEEGFWNFATRTVMLDYSTSISPPFGYNRAFDHPTDYIRLVAISDNEYFEPPLNRYDDEGAYWYADIDQIYIRYVSNDASFGGGLSLWPETFSEWAASHLAFKTAPRLTRSATTVDELRKAAKKLLVDARSKDAMGQPVKFPPRGSWSRARIGGGSRDRGSRGRLIG